MSDGTERGEQDGKAEERRREQERRDLAERADLRERVNGLESLVLSVWTLVAAAALIAGTFVPFGVEEKTDRETGETVDFVYSIFTSMAAMSEGDEGVAIGIGFLGLTLCALVAVVTLFAMWAREGGRALASTATTVAVLMAIGAIVPLVFSGMFLEDEEAGPGALIFAAGVVLYAVTLTPPLARLWKRGPRASR